MNIWQITFLNYASMKPALQSDTCNCFVYKSKLKPRRLTGPTVIFRNGSITWIKEGLYHREDGPALFMKDYNSLGYIKEWRIKNKLHRLDGPAFIGPDGDERYFLNGINYSKEIFDKMVNE